jgi:hypothetical protein
MRRIAIAVALLLIAGLSLGAQSERRYALVIGNGSYVELGRLKNPENDARDMAAALRELGFEVKLLVDADLVAMEEAVERLGGELARSPDSVGFFFYAGHGVQSGGINFLIPADAHIVSESYLKTKSLPAQSVLETLQRARNALNVVVLDACRDNPFSWGRSGSARGLSVVGNQPPGSIIAYATRAGSVAQDGLDRNGIFTAELLKQIRSPGVEIKDMFNRTGKAVTTATAGKQVPAVYNQFFDEAYLAGKAGAGPAPAAAGTASQAGAGPVFGAVTVVPGEVRFAFASPGTLSFLGRSVEVQGSGTLPVSQVSPGDYEAVMTYSDGNRESRSLRVESGASTSVSFSYVPGGVLAVSTDPSGARVLADGVDRGQSPLTIRSLPAGTLTVLVKREGYEDAGGQKRIEAGKTTEVAFILKKRPEQTLPLAGSALAVGGFVRVPAGSLTMGSPASEPNRGSNEVQHEVRLSVFSIGQYEVTQGEWQAVMGSNPSYFKGDDKLPVEQ